ncbi:MAG: hypothetical protein K9G62_06405 [Alphaproteobacteria bacterium]|nr:hypothetical protein [Alphaproteobacteria bacterium]
MKILSQAGLDIIRQAHSHEIYKVDVYGDVSLQEAAPEDLPLENFKGRLTAALMKDREGIYMGVRRTPKNFELITAYFTQVASSGEAFRESTRQDPRVGAVKAPEEIPAGALMHYTRRFPNS